MWKLGIAAIAAGGVGYLALSDDCSQRGLYDAMTLEVASELVAPTSAIFPDAESVVTRFSNDKYSCSIIVDGYVDSQNSFGAMIRTSYSGIASLDDDAETVKVLLIN